MPSAASTASPANSTPAGTSSTQAGAIGATGNGAGSRGAPTGGNGTYGAPTAQISPFLGGAAEVGYDAGMLLCFAVAVISAVVLI